MAGKWLIVFRLPPQFPEGAWPLGLPLIEPIARLSGRPVQVRLRGLTLFARLKRGSNYRAKQKTCGAALGRVASSAKAAPPPVSRLRISALTRMVATLGLGFRVCLGWPGSLAFRVRQRGPFFEDHEVVRHQFPTERPPKTPEEPNKKGAWP